MVVAFIFFKHISGIAMTLIQETNSASENLDLGPILEPEPIKFSFDTPGWYIIGGLLLVAFLILTIRWIKHYRKNAYRRNAIKKLNLINASTSKIELGQQFLDLLVILKLAAFQAYGRKEVATLYGKPWLIFLESKGKNTPFSSFESTVSKAIYENTSPNAKELNDFKNLSKKWIETHA